MNVACFFGSLIIYLYFLCLDYGFNPIESDPTPPELKTGNFIPTV